MNTNNYYWQNFNFQAVDFQTLRLFSLICENGSIGTTAKKAQLATSAVSKRISDLEKHLQVKLFERHNRGVTPTPAAQYLAKHAKQIICQLDSAQVQLQELAAGYCDFVRLHATSSAILAFLATELTTILSAAEKKIKVNLVEQTSPLVAQSVIDGVADIGIGIYSSLTKEQLRSVQTQPYRHDRLALVIPSTHKLAQQTDITFTAALDYEFIGYETSSSIDLLVKMAANSCGKTFKSPIQVSNICIMLALVRQGLGIGIASLRALQQLAPHSGLKLVPLSESWANREFHLFARDFNKLSSAGIKLINFLTNNNHPANHEKNSLR